MKRSTLTFEDFWAVPCGCDGHGDHAACTKACRDYGCTHPKGAFVVCAFEGETQGASSLRDQVDALHKTGTDSALSSEALAAWNDAVDAALNLIGERPRPLRAAPPTAKQGAEDVESLFERLRRAQARFDEVADDYANAPARILNRDQSARLLERRNAATGAVAAARVALVRALRSPRPGTAVLTVPDDDERRLALDQLHAALLGAWSADTSAAPERWISGRPSTGQCAVTAVIVQQQFGGELLRTINEGDSHYFNRLPDGLEVDLTRDQFDTWQPSAPVETRTVDYVLSNLSTLARYQRLVLRLGSAD